MEDCIPIWEAPLMVWLGTVGSEGSCGALTRRRHKIGRCR